MNPNALKAIKENIKESAENYKKMEQPPMDKTTEEELIKRIEEDNKVKKIAKGDNFIQVQVKYPSWKGEIEIPQTITKLTNTKNWNIARIVGVNSDGPIAGIQLKKQ